MKTFFIFLVVSTAVGFYWVKVDKVHLKFSSQWNEQLHFEKKAFELARENRELRAKISDLNYKMNELESKNKFFASQAQGKSRSIASVPQMDANDLVNYDVYKWSPEKLLAIGEKELHFKNYEKSAQFYNELVERFPKHEIVDDRVLFGAGVAAFETGKRYDWSEKHLSSLVKNHPKSEFYRGAKLWLALSQYQQGEHKKFLDTVEEFRLKYRNTEEWKILSRYYEDIHYKVKK
jgi:TolA-binding protein